jgi:hypothetical protein
MRSRGRPGAGVHRGSRPSERVCKTFAPERNMRKIFLGLASLLLPGLGHLVSGHLAVGFIWFGVWLLVFTSPVIAILSAVHCVVDA